MGLYLGVERKKWDERGGKAKTVEGWRWPMADGREKISSASMSLPAISAPTAASGEFLQGEEGSGGRSVVTNGNVLADG